MLADRVKNDVVRLAVFGEVFLQVVDDSIGSKRSHEFNVLGIAHSGDVGIEVSGQLHCGRADGPGGTVDEDAPPRPKICMSQTSQGEDRSVADCCRLFEGHVGRLVGKSAALPDTDVLSMCARSQAEDLVTDRELANVCADCYHLAGQLAAKDAPFRPNETGEEAGDEIFGVAQAAVRPVDGGGTDLDEDLVLLGHRTFDFFKSQNIRRPVPIVNNCSH